jgi:hypothetical protein
MSTLIATLSSSKSIVVRAAEVKQVSTITIQSVQDNVAEKTVYVYCSDLGRIKVNDLSDANYDNPQWTNESLLDALTKQLNLA